MTAPTTAAAHPDRLQLLESRLVALRAERDQTLAETRAEAVGDIVDRATNVEASIRLQLLEERIHVLQDEIDLARSHPHIDGVVSVGDTVVVDLGDGPETYVVGSVEEAVAGIDTVTPASPLGRAIVGAPVGATIRYSPRPGLELSATILSAA
ncbi:GreA/GreB family elongation factor [Nocardioides sp.]|uniref:GreA/GreB family elongation factor n=1 Tax=Nocardioides sp. TaxID=35761 RepID=UPI003518E17F